MKVLTSILSSLSLIASCTTPIQVELDAEVKRMCAIDGGIESIKR
jgi:hypothetical protein